MEEPGLPEALMRALQIAVATRLRPTREGWACAADRRALLGGLARALARAQEGPGRRAVARALRQVVEGPRGGPEGGS